LASLLHESSEKRVGDPKKQRKKYQGPGHPWQGDRISSERELLREYGLKNKKELWKINSTLRNWRSQASIIISLPEKEKLEAQKVLTNKLIKLNLVNKDAQLDDVLSLGTKNILERRLQTIVYKNGLANSVKQARQFISHGKIMVNGKSNSSPSQLLKESDKVELVLGFKPITKKIIEKDIVYPKKVEPPQAEEIALEEST